MRKGVFNFVCHVFFDGGGVRANKMRNENFVCMHSKRRLESGKKEGPCQPTFCGIYIPPPFEFLYFTVFVTMSSHRGKIFPSNRMPLLFLFMYREKGPMEITSQIKTYCGLY